MINLLARHLLFLIIAVVVLFAKSTFAADAEQTLFVGTKVAPPFVIKNQDGSWEGISIELWRDIAVRNQLKFVFVERNLQQLIEQVATGELDVSVAALTITKVRERNIDFSHAFYSTGLSIAVNQSSGEESWLLVFQRLFSWHFFKLIFALTGLLMLVGFLIWLCEHRFNRYHERGIKDLWEGVWWAAVTMTTVGYGDKTPLTIGGRVLALVWMFTALMIVASFIAAFSSALTVKELNFSINKLTDLARIEVATVPGSASAAFLAKNQIKAKNYASPDLAVAALAEGEVDAVLYDAALLKYIIKQQHSSQLRVLPNIFEQQHYGVVLPPQSPLREPVNQALLDIIEQQRWQETLHHYLGE